MIKCCEINKFH